MAASSERYDALIQWVEQAGGSLNAAVEVYHNEVTKGSFRVRAGCKVDKGDSIVTLPLSRSLSFLNALSGHPDFTDVSFPHIVAPENSPYFPVGFLKETPPHVVSRFFLMQQYLLGRDSLWWPYIRTLPQPEHLGGSLPAMWPSDDLEFLAGTNAHVAVEEIKSNLKKEYKQAIKLLPEKFASEYTRPLYLWAYSIFTSRSFRPSLILPFADTEQLPCEIDDFSVLLPLFDIGNHSPAALASWSTDQDGRTCRLQSEQPYVAGDQVFNNYGLKTNAELLLGYGFILPETPSFHNDYVHVKTRPNPEEGDLAATHIVSLRPMSDPSSLIGRSRRVAPGLSHVLERFAHVQDSLVVLLYETITKGGKATVEEIMQGDIPDEVKAQIINALGSKLSMDLDELEAHDPEYEPSNRNQELALQYREQCRKVLEGTLISLSAPEEP